MTGHDERSKAGIITRNRENEAGDIDALPFRRRAYCLNNGHAPQVPRGGLEPPTPGLGNLCSIHLSYRGRRNMITKRTKTITWDGQVAGPLNAVLKIRMCAVDKSVSRGNPEFI